MDDQTNNRELTLEAADQWYASVDVAGSAAVALLYGLGITQVAILRSSGEASWQGRIFYRDTPSLEQTVRICLAGEAALMLFRLQDERTISVWDEHRGLAELVREWTDYWRGFGTQAMIAGLIDSENFDLRIEDTEIAAILALFRCQAYRLLRQGSHLAAVEDLAEQLREVKILSGEEVEALLQRQSGSEAWSGHTPATNSEEPQLFCPDFFGDWRQGTKRSIT